MSKIKGNVPRNIPHLEITTTVAFVDNTGCLYEHILTQQKDVVSSVREWERLKGKNFWEVLTLIFIDSWMPSSKQVDEITGHIGYRFGRKVKGKKNEFSK